MENGLLYPYNFGNRLLYLIDESGININKRGFTTTLSTKLFQDGIIEYTNQTNDETEKAKQRDNVRKRIDEHLKLDSASNVSGVWLHRYCNYFKCSSDFLFGLIDLPKHSHTDIQKETGLSESSIKLLNSFTTYQKGLERLAIIDYLLKNSDFTHFLIDALIKYYEKYEDYQISKKTLTKESQQIKEKAGNDFIKKLELIQTGELVQTINRHQLAERENIKEAAQFNVLKMFDNISISIIEFFYNKNYNNVPETK